MAKDSSKINFLKNETTHAEIHNKLEVRYFKNKVDGWYNKQDKVAGKKVDLDKYPVDKEVCFKHVHGCCAHNGIK